jgi:hypothetical protein
LSTEKGAFHSMERKYSNNGGSSTKILIYIICFLTVVDIIFISGCVQPTAPPEKPSPTQILTKEPSILIIKPINLSGVHTERSSLIKYYSSDSVNIKLQATQYDLPLQTSEVSNFQDFTNKISLSKDAVSHLEKNGFVVIKYPDNIITDQIAQPYKDLRYKDIPLFITSDSLLHAYHVLFDEILIEVEAEKFYDETWYISKELLNDAIRTYKNSTGDLKEASRRNAAYFAIELSLLEPKEEQICKEGMECNYFMQGLDFQKGDMRSYSFTVPDFIIEDVKKELELIDKHQGFNESPLFVYKEDYSQYDPRGHYTRSEKLKNYFRALVWYGRMSMLLKGTDEIQAGGQCNYDNCKAFISAYDAKIQTIQASLIASKLYGDKELKSKWERIYSVTSFYAGLADDLGPYEYNMALDTVFNGRFDPKNFTEDNMEKLKLRLAEYRTPEIYGGTGDCVILPPFNPEDLETCLDKSKGFRLMGQRFAPDSYMFQNLVFPKVGQLLVEGRPFTMVMTPFGPKRGFPRGLDIMALLGSKRAKELLNELNDSNYEGYEKQFGLLKEKFDGLNESEWNKNLYWSWLYTLRALLKESGDGYPTFMQTRAWQDKELTAVLASWTELRHDTLLYSKQSYTSMPGAVPPLQNTVVGYVEPVPEFYNRLSVLTGMTEKGMKEMNVLGGRGEYMFENFNKILGRLSELSRKELENDELSEEDYRFIKGFGEELEGVITTSDPRTERTTLIADVHTDDISEQVLEEGVGYVDLIVVAYKVPGGKVILGAGPVMTYYEFKQPLQDRLTDEAWIELLSSNPPQHPGWISNFAEESVNQRR